MEDRRKQPLWTDDAQRGIVIRAGGRASDRVKAMFLRRAVFVDEMLLPDTWVRDGQGEDAVALIATDDTTGVLVGVAYVRDAGSGVAEIEQLAVSPSFRGAGLGTALLQAAIRSARDLQFATAFVQALPATVPFFARQRFAPQGEEVSLAGVPVRRMVLSLTPEATLPT